MEREKWFHSVSTIMKTLIMNSMGIKALNVLSNGQIVPPAVLFFLKLSMFLPVK